MKLLQPHIEALLSELDKAQQDELLQCKLADKEQKTGGDLLEWFEISHYLAKRRIADIKQAIIQSEIDY